VSDAARERTPLEIERDALVSIAAWSAGQEHLAPVELETALADLAELTKKGTRQSPRLVVLERLVRAAARRGEEFLAAESSGRQGLLGALIEAAPDDAARVPNPDTAVIDVPRSLEDIDVLEGALRGNANLVPAVAYRNFAASARITLALQPHETTAPSCDDSEPDRPAGGVAANMVSAQFFSARPFADFGQWMDPTAWHGLCPWFFDSMVPLIPAAQQIAPVPNLHLGGWRQSFDETVLLVPNDPWTTCLHFTHLRSASDLHTDYRLAQHADAPEHFPALPSGAFAPPPHPVHLIVDHGFLAAEDDPFAGAPLTTRVTLTKITKFVDADYDKWTTLACDTFWLDLAMAMADAAATTDT
jgi:hypothetical protein